MSSSSSTVSPTLELKQEVREKIDKYLENSWENLHRLVGQTVRLVCHHPITVAVTMELPGSHLVWLINGSPLIMDPSRVFYYKGNIDITDLSPSDTGVYECIVRWTSGNILDNVTVGVYSLQVSTLSATRYIFEYEPLKLVCNSGSLGRLFPAATRQWFFNETAFTLLPSLLADNETVEVIHKIHKNQSGVWKCQVTHSRSGRVWDTAWLNVTVQDPPSFIARWYRQMADHVGIVFAALGLIIIISFLIFLYSAYQVKHIEDEADDEFKRQRADWEDIFSGFVEKGEITAEDFPEPEPKETSLEEEDEEEEDVDEDTDEEEHSESEDVPDNARFRGQKVSDVNINKVLVADDSDKNTFTNTGRVYVRNSRRRRLLDSTPPRLQGALRSCRSPRHTSLDSIRDCSYTELEKRHRPRPSSAKMFTALNKQEAFQWLFKNSADMRTINALLKETADISLVDLDFSPGKLVSSTDTQSFGVDPESTACKSLETSSKVQGRFGQQEGHSRCLDTCSSDKQPHRVRFSLDMPLKHSEQRVGLSKMSRNKVSTRSKSSGHNLKLMPSRSHIKYMSLPEEAEDLV
ncbi:hypothetical protein Bpfe_029028 [Biomphalaria pfeifferi]|uniref:Ig-like domain-containing protein n=1 Tax=Biomphalaria pfeifferi TaxID=112525 RepID=A0AAD8ASD8_BIOPF|nr:hypothetical protein Bpfe_029028 [Biomphalaria pfeifferi]